MISEKDLKEALSAAIYAAFVLVGLGVILVINLFLPALGKAFLALVLIRILVGIFAIVILLSIFKPITTVSIYCLAQRVSLEKYEKYKKEILKIGYGIVGWLYLVVIYPILSLIIFDPINSLMGNRLSWLFSWLPTFALTIGLIVIPGYLFIVSRLFIKELSRGLAEKIIKRLIKRT